MLDDKKILLQKGDKMFRFVMGKNDDGFTLVEILVALVILLLVITATFPLFTLATNMTHENKARLTANELAKRELERVLSQVTASNYHNENDSDPGGAPLKTGTTGPYKASLPDGTPDPAFASYDIYKHVIWVDDPDDGLAGKGDFYPFDYKELVIEVKSPSLFTGKMVQRANFKTFVAREGLASPITGIIVNVVRGFPSDDGKRIPIEGAYITINPSEGSGGSSQSVITNLRGQAMFPISFPEKSTDVYAYEIEASYSTMITPPDKQYTAEARPYTTNVVEIEMEYPSALTLQFAPCKEDAELELSAGELKYRKTLAANSSSLSFDKLWPLYTYTVNVSSMLLYNHHFIGEDTVDLSPEPHNLWKFDEYNDYWSAGEENVVLGEEEAIQGGEHRLSFSQEIDIKKYKPAGNRPEDKFTPELFGVFAGNDSFCISGININNGDDFTLFCMGKEGTLGWDNEHNKLVRVVKNADGLQLLDFKSNSLAKISGDEIIFNGISFPIDEKFFDQPFQMRLASYYPQIGTFYFRDFKLVCSYSKSGITFKEAEENLTLRVNGN